MESHLLGSAHRRSIGRLLAQKVVFGRNRRTSMSMRLSALSFLALIVANTSISASVNPDGSYGQKIQIEAIAGRNGLTPQVELVYNSNGGNGAAGMGWSLSFPTISRSANRAIHYDSTDFFVGPSGRLTLVNGDYIPQNQDWTRYLPQGQTGGAPASWIVKTNDGKTMYFGDTTDSFVVGENPDGSTMGGGAARLWALSKVVDQWGQTIEYNYEKHGGQIYLKQIKYAQANNLGRFNAISFKYSPSRPDIETTFYGGRVYTQYRLEEIAITSGILDIWPLSAFTGDLVKRYIFAYDQSPASGRSRLTSVQIQSASQTLANTVFAYNGVYVDNYTLQTPIGTAENVGLWANGIRAGDFTGDGLTDLAAYSDSGGIYCVMTGSTFGFNGQACMDVMRAGIQTMGDFNGDGRMDLAGYTTVSNIYCIIFGATYGLSGQSCMPASGGRLIADFNADGRDDMAFLDDSGNFYISYGEPGGVSGPQMLFAIMDPYDSYDPNTNQPLWQRPPPRGPMDPPPLFEPYKPSYAGTAKAGDFNGDGYADLAVWTTVQDIWCIAYGSPSGVQKQVCMHGGVTALQFLVADFNNDGYSDVAGRVGGGTWCISHGTRSGFNPQVCMPGLGIDANGVFPGDYNGDGYPDLAAYTGNGGTWCITYGNGFGINPQVCPTNVLATGDAHIGDFNGDGYTDITAYTGVRGIWVIARGQGHLDADRLTTITASSGARESINYTNSRQTGGMFDVNETNPWVRANNGIFFVVSQITNESNMDLDDDGQPDFKRVTYAYRGAKVIATGPITERTNLGFAGMTATDEVTHHYTVIQYRQDKPFVGMISSQIEYEQNGNKVSEMLPASVAQYQCTSAGCAPNGAADLTVGRRILSSGRNTTINYEAGLEVSRKYEAVLAYDLFGNATAIQQGIEANGQAKQSFTSISYINNTDPANFVIGLAYAERGCLYSPDCTAGDGSLLGEARSYYDLQPLGSVGTRRAVTKKETYSAGAWLQETFIYDNTGKVYDSTDGFGVRTEIIYDNIYDRFPSFTTKSHGGKIVNTSSVFDARFNKATYVKNIETGIEQRTTLDDAGFALFSWSEYSGNILTKKSFNHSPYNAPRAWVEECAHYGAGFAAVKCTRKYSDAFGRLYREEFPEFVNGAYKQMAVEHRYDRLSREVKTSQPFDAAFTGCIGTTTAGSSPFACQWNTKVYDVMNRVTAANTWNNRTSTFQYETSGVPIPAVAGTISTGPDGKQKRTYNNIHGKTAATYDAQQSGNEYTVVSYSYDDRGRLSYVRSPQGKTDIEYLPNSSIQRSITDPVAGKTDFDYYLTPGRPDFGKLKTETRGGYVTTFEYAATFGRVSKTTKASVANPSVPVETMSYTYDETDKQHGKGRLTTLVHAKDGYTIKERYSYDERGEIVQTVRTIRHDTLALCAYPDAVPCTQEFGKTKDTLGRVTDMMYPDGTHSTVEYVDAFSPHVSKIRHEGQVYAEYTNYTYDVAAHVGKITYGNGLQQSYAYYPDAGMLDTFKIASGSTPLIDLKYEYDASYNIYQIHDNIVTGLSATFEYDAHNRIKTATLDSGKVRTYRFDRSGQKNTQGNLELKDNRRLSYASNPNSPDNRLTYPESDEVFNESTGQWQPNQNFTWSATGNLLTKGPFTFAYDANNMMVRATERESTASSNVVGETKFYYDHTGQRFLKTHTRSGVTINTWYLGDGIEYREKYIGVTSTSAGSFDAYQTTKYIYGIDDKKLASITGIVKVTQPTPTPTNLYALADSYSSSSITGLANKAYYTFYGIYQHENASKAAKIAGLSLAALLLLLYLIRTQRRASTFPIWMRVTAMTMLISFVSVNCGTGNAPGSTPADLSGLGAPGDTTTAAQPANTLISALYTGLPVGTVFYSHNHLGSGALITDSAGNEVFRITYTEYGEIDLANSGKWNATLQDFERNVSDAEIAIIAVKYTGQEYDPETGLYYYNARYYDPQLGVFTTIDSVVPNGEDSQSYNRHMYVRGNPVLYNDPTGHVFGIDDFLIGVAITALVAGTANATVTAAQHNWDFANNWGKIGTSFAIGAGAGAAGAIAGAWAGAYVGFGSALGSGASTLGVTMTEGMVGGMVGGFVAGSGNAWANGAGFGEGLAYGFAGGVIGGAAGGVLAGFGHSAGRFWDDVSGESAWQKRLGQLNQIQQELENMLEVPSETYQWGGPNPFCNSRGCIPVQSGNIDFDSFRDDPGFAWGGQNGSLNSHESPALDFPSRGTWRGPVNNSFKVLSAGAANDTRLGSILRIQLENGDQLSFVHLTKMNSLLKLSAGSDAVFRGDTVLGDNMRLIGRTTGYHLHVEGVTASGRTMSTGQIMRTLRGY